MDPYFNVIARDLLSTAIFIWCNNAEYIINYIDDFSFDSILSTMSYSYVTSANVGLMFFTLHFIKRYFFPYVL